MRRFLKKHIRTVQTSVFPRPYFSENVSRNLGNSEQHFKFKNLLIQKGEK